MRVASPEKCRDIEHLPLVGRWHGSPTMIVDAQSRTAAPRHDPPLRRRRMAALLGADGIKAVPRDARPRLPAAHMLLNAMGLTFALSLLGR
jgi:hypothetical protein